MKYIAVLFLDYYMLCLLQSNSMSGLRNTTPRTPALVVRSLLIYTTLSSAIATGLYPLALQNTLVALKPSTSVAVGGIDGLIVETMTYGRNSVSTIEESMLNRANSFGNPEAFSISSSDSSIVILTVRFLNSFSKSLRRSPTRVTFRTHMSWSRMRRKECINSRSPTLLLTSTMR
ncbi:hypothetical protein FR483_n085L [Paramecium bursaria Chlorella virus FR483]|uniref:Uncharacterized protein n085L n=1 Tax=Paramecium bursaria Chlorella virus FR483 TaxID=399781 RepID=A7J6D9_PBCVF|nr:hypothetical protein FR483_n085L [Paramecium bursaria Chlorella virus FR483]ABT15370.1 hypothetical protein FR483_n085L [Paramecium bursaria Chlorella virus FR483]